MNPPARIGPWRPQRLLGQGAVAAVWLAEDDRGAVAAVKWWLHPAPAGHEQEVRLLLSLDHPGIVRVLGHGEEEGRPWIAMEALAGPDLRAYAEKLRRRPPSERIARSRSIGRQVGAALGYLAGRGVVHRDVKPANILLDARGDAILTDLGVAVWAADATGGAFVGTTAYAAPEAIRGERPGPAADQYGLGCVLYQLLTGRRPFEGDTARLLRAHLDEAPRPPSAVDPTVPPDLDAFVLRLLAKHPADRFPDIAAATRSLDEAPGSGLPLAGRQAAVDAVAAALDEVAAGRRVFLHLQGTRGSGRRWLMQLASTAALRRELSCVTTNDPEAAAEAAAREEPLLLVSSVPVPGAVPVPLGPLGLGDVRRTVYSTAPRTPRFAEQAERLHRLSGGNVRMLTELLGAHTREGVFALPEAPGVDPEPFLAGLDLDALAVATALALNPGALDLARLRALAQAPPEEVLPELRDRAVAVEVGGGWRLAAEVLRPAILERSPDVEAIRARMAAPVEALPDDPARTEARRLRIQGRYDEARRVLEEAPPIGGPAGAERALALGFVRWHLGDMAGAEEAYRAAAAMAGPPSTRARAGIGVGIVALLTGRLHEAMDRFVAAATEASIARDAVRESVAWLDLCEARSVAGQLAGAIDAGFRALHLASGAGDREMECAAMRHLGQALLDVGAVDEAYARLGDATALARALQLEDERVATHCLRARATLDARPRDRSAAASALDRLIPLLQSRAPDPEGFGLLVRAVWARATAQLGDMRMYRRAVAEADLSRAGARVTVRLRAEVELLRAHLLAGEQDAAAQLGERLVTEADRIGAALLAWEARRALARAAGGPLPEAGALALGLEPRLREKLEGR